MATITAQASSVLLFPVMGQSKNYQMFFTVKGHASSPDGKPLRSSVIKKIKGDLVYTSNSVYKVTDGSLKKSRNSVPLGDLEET